MTVHYPSGRRFDLRGELRILDDPDRGVLPVVFDGDEQAHVLDPRAVIRDDSGDVIYHPRKHTKRMTPELRLWMVENQDWPGEEVTR